MIIHGELNIFKYRVKELIKYILFLLIHVKILLIQVFAIWTQHTTQTGITIIRASEPPSSTSLLHATRFLYFIVYASFYLFFISKFGWFNGNYEWRMFGWVSFLRSFVETATLHRTICNEECTNHRYFFTFATSATWMQHTCIVHEPSTASLVNNIFHTSILCCYIPFLFVFTGLFLVFQTLLPSTPVDFVVEKITASHEGSYLALSGKRGVTVLELPRRWGANGQYKEGKERILCRYDYVHFLFYYIFFCICSATFHVWIE